MSRSERTYSQLFALLRDTQPAATFTPEEIQSLIEQPVAVQEPSSRRAVPGVAWIGTAVAVLAVSVIALWQWPFTGSDTPATPAGAAPASPAPPNNAAAYAHTPANVHGDASSAGQTTATTPATAPAAPVQPNVSHRATTLTTRTVLQSTTAHAAIAPEKHSARTVMTSSIADTAHGASGMARSSTPRATETMTTPMLELTPGELEAIGVTFVDGTVQTFGEEYYRLASDRDRTEFAQMGMDTTESTGVVRMRLVIDTFGLTTRKYAWTRPATYSRIAPIIALNSFVQDEHHSSSMVSSFERSPIMDSAKRSTNLLMPALTSMLTSKDIERILNDTDHANPIRRLVPVHIRLGDQPINGSAKRRGADVILWYYPTMEFVAALPTRYRISLQKELNAIADVEECNLPPGEACRRMTGEPSLLNYCRRSSGAVRSLYVSPNAATGTVTIRYVLDDRRTVGAMLYSLRGEFVRELAPAAEAAGGTHSTSAKLGSVKPGAYMVVLRSDQGEQVAERLIVQ